MNTETILHFLHQLAANNNRDWMTANKSFYLEAKEAFVDLIQELIQKIAVFDPTVTDLQPKDCIFRINRDVRFSKNKAPYKINFGAAIAPGGKKSVVPGYYFQIQPDNQSFTAGGAYMPPSNYLKSIRQEIDYNAESFASILNEPSFKRFFPRLEGERLKTAPRGYSEDNPAIEWLRQKSFIVFHNISDDQIRKDGLVDQVIEQFRTLHPLNEFLRILYEDLV